MSVFVVGYIEWNDNELVLERVEASTWKEAVIKHSKFPWDKNDIPEGIFYSEEQFQKECFDVDCMMNWLKLP